MQEVNVLIVIDTDKILQEHSTLSQDPNNPTGLRHDSQYMICTGAQVNSGQGTADLSFKANVGDEVSFRGVSISGNSEDAIIVYGIKYWKADQVFNNFVADMVTRKNAVMPNTSSDNGLPAVHGAASFTSFDSKVRNAGTEYFYVYIAVYKLSADGENQNFVGYCYWDPQITVA